MLGGIIGAVGGNHNCWIGCVFHGGGRGCWGLGWGGVGVGGHRGMKIWNTSLNLGV